MGESFDLGTHPVRMWTGIKPKPRFQVGYLWVSDLFYFRDSKIQNLTRRGRVSGDGSTEPHLCFRPFPDENANESLPAYQKNRYPIRDNGFSYMLGGTRKAGPGAAGVKNSPGDCFSGRGRVPWFPDASGTDVDGNQASQNSGIRTPEGVRSSVSKNYGIATGLRPSQ